LQHLFDAPERGLEFLFASGTFHILCANIGLIEADSSFVQLVEMPQHVSRMTSAETSTMLSICWCLGKSYPFGWLALMHDFSHHHSVIFPKDVWT
jgi:hypothetical protein